MRFPFFSRRADRRAEEARQARETFRVTMAQFAQAQVDLEAARLAAGRGTPNVNHIVRGIRERGNTATLNNDYVDATAFGDVNRTYLTGATTITETTPDGTLVHTYQLHRERATLPPETPEEREARVAREREEVKRIAKAKKRADELLASYLTPREWGQYQNGELTVNGKHITYKVDRFGRVHTEKPVRGVFCVSPVDRSIPYPDRVLTMKLWIEHREEEFLAEANWTDHLGIMSNLGKLGIEGKPVPGSHYQPGGRGYLPRGRVYQRY